ncbi:RDD family protein [Nocardioides sp.]|uniref:RDD family protein n=1 Tax=Nocardioides sp. TaxID=35761 RepID=UPI003D096051
MSEPTPDLPRASYAVDAVPVEARPFQGQRAGAVTRTAANTIDGAIALVCIVAGYVGWAAASFLRHPPGFSFPTPSFLSLLIAWGLLLFLYLSAAWATTGRTYGNHVLGLRVVNHRGGRLRWATAMLRAGFCLAVPLGLYWVLISQTNRSLQDNVLRTSVIYDWTTRRESAARAA